VPSDSIIRSLFVSGPDNVLLQADYSQVEFRLAGILSGDEWLINQFVEGRNFHEEVALELFGPDYTDLEKLRAKAVNFGMLYGRGAASLAGEHGGSFNYWQQRINDWFARMPRVKEYQKGLEQQIKERGYLESYFGRKRRFWLVTKENWHQVQKEGYNFPLQSTASDLTLDSLIRLEPLLRGKAAPVVTVHDSIMFEVRRQYLDEVAHTVKEVMEDTPVKDICPTTVDITVGTEWGKHMEDYVHA
jgi:DNA polymerase-1